MKDSRSILTPWTAIVEKTAGYVARNGIVFEGESLGLSEPFWWAAADGNAP